MKEKCDFEITFSAQFGQVWAPGGRVIMLLLWVISHQTEHLQSYLLYWAEIYTGYVNSNFAA